MDLDLRMLGAIALGFGSALLLTPFVRDLARRWGLVSRPRADRWAKKPAALYGGVAIFAATLLASLPILGQIEHGWLVLSGSAFLFVVGLVDDYLRIKPYQKLIGQIMGTCLILLGGLALPWTASPLVNMAFTLFWLVGITNAFNLLDNMDGLAAGVAAIASAFLATNFLANGQLAEAVLLAAFAAALFGFLVYNSNPASIFMGDCGSMFIGFFLASTSLLHVSGGRSRSLFSVLAVPVLLLLIPIFDTTLVTVLRKLAGRAASQGGRDHASHRLVALGLSERRAVGLLYGLATLSGLLAMCASAAPIDVSLVLIGAFTLALAFLGIHLAEVKVYEQDEELDAGKAPVATFLVNLSYKRRLFEVLLDVALICLCYYTANLLYFGPLGEDGAWHLLVQTLPILVFLKLAALLTMGVYRGLWRYIGMNDLAVYVKAVGLGSLVSVLVFLLLFRFQNLSRVVFILDGLLLLVMVIATRVAFRMLRSVLHPAQAAGGRRALIAGAGDAGELLLREMRNNPELGCVPVGFADDDPKKTGKMIHGLPVFGGNGSLTKICREQKIDEVYISSLRFSEERVREIREMCKDTGITLRRLRITFETLHEEDTALSRVTAAGFAAGPKLVAWAVGDTTAL
jgi:UDP-GlcNAc:undecaprenyl-phosphate GlcNAc-1-phosphate transferase